MTQLQQFKDFNIKPQSQAFTGDKIKMSKILNRRIIVHDFKIEDSKQKSGTQCLYLQISVNENKHVVFTGSTVLMETIQRVPPTGFPFETTIVKENERFEFT